MYEVIFYKDKNGKNEIEKYLLNLQKRKDKSSRIKVNKIIAYIDMLLKYGLTIGEPYIKYISNNIWELRPLRNRIFFSYLNNNKFILLSIFMKQTRKTPEKEIEKARRYLQDFFKRRDSDG